MIQSILYPFITFMMLPLLLSAPQGGSHSFKPPMMAKKVHPEKTVIQQVKPRQTTSSSIQNPTLQAFSAPGFEQPPCAEKGLSIINGLTIPCSFSSCGTSVNCDITTRYDYCNGIVRVRCDMDTTIINGCPTRIMCYSSYSCTDPPEFKSQIDGDNCTQTCRPPY